MKIKKFSIILAAIISLATLMPTNSFAAEISDELYQKYDFNSDGLINGDDIFLIIRRYSEIATGNTIISEQSVRENIDKNADIDSDNVINANDAAKLSDLIKEKNSMGDVNCDKIIDARDASSVLTYYTRLSNEDYKEKELSIGIDYGVAALGDYDKNGIIDARDASAILVKYASNSVS